MSPISWKTKTEETECHELWTITGKNPIACSFMAPAAPATTDDVVAWLRAAPEAVRGEVLGAFVAHEHTYAELVARAEKSEAEVERVRATVEDWPKQREAVQTAALRAEEAEAELKAAHAALDGGIGRHPNGNVLEPPLTLAARIEAYRTWARRLADTVEERTSERDAARAEVARLAPTVENRAARRNAIREALHKAWSMGFGDAAKVLQDRFDWTAKFQPATTYVTDYLIPTEFR